METTESKSWFGLINESVHTSDDVDIGDIEAINKYFIVVKRGIVNVHYYYIPVTQVEGWDGKVLWLKVSEDEVKNKYERSFPPHPSTYYKKAHADYLIIEKNFSTVPMISIEDSKYETEIEEPPGKVVKRVFSCPLCNEVFQTEDELGKHLERGTP